VQGNIKQELRWDTEQEMPTMQKYMRLTRPYFGDSLIIWPEAAIPRLEHQSQGFLINLDMLAAENNSAVVTGILDIRYNVGDFNGMIVLGQTNTEAILLVLGSISKLPKCGHWNLVDHYSEQPIQALALSSMQTELLQSNCRSLVMRC
jgi:hypothetical protein